MKSFSRALLSWCLLVAGLAAALGAADRVPALLTGIPHGARSFETLAEADAAFGARVWVPSSPVPGPEAWTVVRVDGWPGPPLSVAVHLRLPSGGSEGLVLVQSIESPAQPPEALLPAMPALMTVEVPVGRHTATLTRALAPGGQVLHDLWWQQGTRRLTIRYGGPVEHLLLVAAGLERTHS